jgi:hypothetical protein
VQAASVSREPVGYLEFWSDELQPALAALPVEARRRFAIACAARVSDRFRAWAAESRPSRERVFDTTVDAVWNAVVALGGVTLERELTELRRLEAVTATAEELHGAYRAVTALRKAAESVSAEDSARAAHAASEAFAARATGETLRRGEALEYSRIVDREKRSRICQREIAFQRRMLRFLAEHPAASREELAALELIDS